MLGDGRRGSEQGGIWLELFRATGALGVGRALVQGQTALWHQTGAGWEARRTRGVGQGLWDRTELRRKG